MNRRRVSLGKRFRVISVAGGMPERQVSSPERLERKKRRGGGAGERASERRIAFEGGGRGGEGRT